MLFLLPVALHNIRWGARLPPPSRSVSRANFNFYVVLGEHYDFSVAYLFAFGISRMLHQLYFR